MKTFEVKQLRVNFGKIRTVDVPYSKLTGDVYKDLEMVFHYGQNGIQPKDSPSVSTGDLIFHPSGDEYVVKVLGFELLTPDLKATLLNSFEEAKAGGFVGNCVYSEILWRKMGKAAFQYC